MATLRKLALGTLAVFAALCLVIAISVIYKNVVKKTSYINIYREIVFGLGGRDKPAKTLILFSNNAEQRYGGGFIGSVGYIAAEPSGKLQIDPIHSVYYYDHLKEAGDPGLEVAPGELSGLSQQIWLRDSGYSLSWPVNAERAAKLFEYESGKKVNNVVMLTPNVIKAILAKTGPIELKEYGFKVSADNFLQKVQLEVEAGGDKVAGKDPKTILGVLANSLIERLYSQASVGSVTEYSGLVKEMAQARQFAIYSRDRRLEHLIGQAGLSGNLAPAEGNYLSIAEANIGANKSSPFIEQSVTQHLVIEDDGTARVQLDITRHHSGSYSHQYVDPHDGQTKWLVGANASYLKLSLPVGTKVGQTSFEQSRPAYDESGRMVVTWRADLEPGATAHYQVNYILPYKYVMHGALTISSMFDKQIGSYPQTISQTMSVPNGYQSMSGKLLNGSTNQGSLEAEKSFRKQR